MLSSGLPMAEHFLFIPANLLFIFFCFLISFILSKIFKSVIVFFLLLISLLSIGYYDLFIKFAVKNYYGLTQMDSIIYDYPSKDKDSKIESLSMEGVYIYPLKYSTTLSLVEKEEIAKIHENYVDKFIDISTYAHKFNKYIYNTERVYLNAYRYNSSLINNDIEKESRFIISKSFEKNPFPDFFGKYEYKFIDKKTNTLLATAFKISFLTNFNKFRNKYLYWSQEKEEEFNPPAVQNFDNIYKKLFIDSK